MSQFSFFLSNFTECYVQFLGAMMEPALTLVLDVIFTLTVLTEKTKIAVKYIYTSLL